MRKQEQLQSMRNRCQDKLYQKLNKKLKTLQANQEKAGPPQAERVRQPFDMPDMSASAVDERASSAAPKEAVKKTKSMKPQQPNQKRNFKQH